MSATPFAAKALVVHLFGDETTQQAHLSRNLAAGVSQTGRCGRRRFHDPLGDAIRPRTLIAPRR